MLMRGFEPPTTTFSGLLLCQLGYMSDIKEKTPSF
jgi:hypothetical protein